MQKKKKRTKNTKKKKKMSHLAERSSHDERHEVPLHDSPRLSHEHMEKLMINVTNSPIDHPVELN